MAVLIDPPRWPAHGTAWSHLVSDSSLDELHAFARRVGIPRRGFDLDHYDAPANLYDEIVALGAEAVSGPELTRRLLASGLRVRPVERRAVVERQRLEFLRAEWMRVGTLVGSDGGGETPSAVAAASWVTLGDDLVARWSEPHRRYHDLVHLHDVLLALDQLSLWGHDVEPVAPLAAWFHDAVYDGVPGQDERRSADLAHDALAGIGVDARTADRVRAAVLATDPSASGTDPAIDPLLDADLAILAAGPKRYRAYTEAVRAEYAHVPDEAFRSGRAAILESFLARERLYRTDVGHAHWDALARANLAREIAALRAR